MKNRLLRSGFNEINFNTVARCSLVSVLCNINYSLSVKVYILYMSGNNKDKLISSKIS